MSRERTPWPMLLTLAAHLGVTPRAFWRLSLREWRALSTTPSNPGLPRIAFDALAAQFPDEA